MKKYFLFSSLLLASCLGNVANVHTIKKQLNSMVGKPAPEYTRMHYWNEVDNTKDAVELEFKRPDGCSYAILVDKDSNIVKSWRFTSEISACERDVYAPSI